MERHEVTGYHDKAAINESFRLADEFISRGGQESYPSKDKEEGEFIAIKKSITELITAIGTEVENKRNPEDIIRDSLFMLNRLNKDKK